MFGRYHPPRPGTVENAQQRKVTIHVHGGAIAECRVHVSVGETAFIVMVALIDTRAVRADVARGWRARINASEMA